MVRLWEVGTGQLKAILDGHGHPVLSVAFSPDGQILASGGGWHWEGDFGVRLWATDTGQVKATLEGHTGAIRSLSFSSDARTLASGSMDATILLWDMSPYSRLQRP